MTAPRASACPGCGHRRLSAPYRIARQPVVLNYRCATAAEALRVKRRDLCLVQCARCGLIFNATLDPALIPYDANYENRQCFSPAFRAHLEELAGALIARHDLRGKPILEVGCGKGDFLKLLCRRAQARGAGYDTSFAGATGRARGGVRFFRRYVTARDITEPFAAVICRHVVEHVAGIGTFLRELHATAQACGDPVTVLETPAFEWIAEHLSFWDLFYEHGNYFTQPCLAWLCQRAGFEVADHRRVFGGQYQVLELRLARGGPAGIPRAPRIPSICRLARFARRAEARLAALEERLARAGAAQGWAIWGAGAKGVALVSRLRRARPRFVIDSNHAKQGCAIPGSRVPVIAPQDPRIRALALVLIANPNYEAEITSTLRQSGFTRTILTT